MRKDVRSCDLSIPSSLVSALPLLECMTAALAPFSCLYRISTMLRLAVLVLSALLLRAAQGIDNELLLSCQSSFNDDLANAVANDGDQCQPYIDLNTCLTSVIVGGWCQPHLLLAWWASTG